jgi:hypothetical protein
LKIYIIVTTGFNYSQTGLHAFAVTYGTNAYDSSTYGGTSTQTTTGASPTSRGTLVNTGVAIAGFVAIACLVLAAAILVRVWHRSSAKDSDARVE